MEIIVNGITYVPKQQLVDGMKYQIVRCQSSGVFAGYVESRNGSEVVMRNVRWIWYWEGAASLAQLAMSGTSKPDKCRFPEEIDRIELIDVIQVFDTTEKAKESIKGVPVWVR